ncbi:MAG TPA: WD40 repeat domain-containing protein [Sphingomonas sp.]|nr:WD40 repeat domain-containing protein [Sphingomonas sp.]
MTKASRFVLLLVFAAACACKAGERGNVAADRPLELEQSIALPNVAGRIDHLAYDPQGDRLFVAELGNGTVDAVDIRSGRVVGRVTGLVEPQGLAWLAKEDELAVASSDGSVGFYRGDELKLVAKIGLGADADDLRIDSRSGQLVVGYGSGGLARIDPVRHAVVANLPLPVHPEGFEVEGDTAYVNLPDAGTIVAGNLGSGAITARWPTGLRRLNFPMALDGASHTLAVAFRLPSRLAILNLPPGTMRQVLPTCGDSDDLFFDASRRRIYVICGSGDIGVYQLGASGYAELARIPTRKGARTGLFVPQEDRLFIAARASDRQTAAILVFRPVSQGVRGTFPHAAPSKAYEAGEGHDRASANRL